MVFLPLGGSGLPSSEGRGFIGLVTAGQVESGRSKVQTFQLSVNLMDEVTNTTIFPNLLRHSLILFFKTA